MRRTLHTLVLLLAALAPAAAAQPLTLALDPGASTLAYTGHHPLHDWTGTSDAVTGTLTFDPTDPARTRVELVVPVSSFDSGNGNRDSNMLDVVEVDRYPEVRFVADGVAVDRWEATADGYRGAWRVGGTLTFHGVEQPVEVPVTVELAGRTLDVRGDFTVSLSSFDVDRPSLLFMKIRDTIDLEAAFQATLPGATATK